MADAPKARSRGDAFGVRATWSLGAVMLGAALLALASPGCLERRDEPPSDPNVTRCTSCHGDPDRPGDYLARAAPPKDLLQQTDPSYPGVGSHSLHLSASDTHAAIACNECHVIPADVDSPGHADDGPPGDVVFGKIGGNNHSYAAYDGATQTCVDSNCHRAVSGVWSLPRSSAEACGTCHGLPPAAPHPQSDRCDVCHGEVIDADRRFIAPERHVNGIVDYVAGDCKQCHGSDDNAAPPRDTLGNSDFSAIGVGAHQVHLSGGISSRPLECDECHVVPRDVGAPTHADGLPAEVRFRGVAETITYEEQWDAATATCSGTYCHAPSPGDLRSSPVWNEEKSLDCGSCHGLPPALPHPQSETCSACHGAVVGADNRTIVDTSRHVDGIVQVSTDATCTSCHGTVNPAPPVDLDGHDDTTLLSVGAHQTHVLGTTRSRAVPCAECHLVPEELLASGHLDSARPVELSFSGVALAQGAAPRYEDGTCQSTSCHGAVFPGNHLSGGSNTAPSWTRVDGTEAACGSCHGLPPPPPHPFASPEYPCQACHANVADDGVSFTHPELHVDGIVTLQLE